FNNGHAQRYVPSTNTWVDAGTVPVQLSSYEELGPAFLLPDGRALFFGDNGNTAYYTPSTNTWTAGPVIPLGLATGDVPGAELPNGDVLIAAQTNPLHPPTALFEFNPTTNTHTNVTPFPATLDTTGPAYIYRMLVLPTGQVLVTTSGDRL